MEEKEVNVQNLSCELSNMLINAATKFYEKNNRLLMKDIFVINSIGISLFLAKIIGLLYKNDTDVDYYHEYIDNVAKETKKLISLVKNKLDEVN